MSQNDETQPVTFDEDAVADTEAPEDGTAPSEAPADEPAETGDAEADAAPVSITANGPVNVRHRKAPKVGRFVVFGLLVGGIVAFVLAIVSRGNSALSMSNSFWLLLLWLGPLGMGLGLLTAYLMDRRSITQMDRQQAPTALPDDRKD